MSRTSRLLLALTFILALAGSAQAAVGTTAADTWYVRPSGACANNGDGLSYGCAASNGAAGAFVTFANVIWTGTTGVDDGDTLYVCGAHATMLAPTGSGAAGSPITIRGDCPSDHGTINTVGLTDTTDGIQILDISYITIRAFDFLAGNRAAVLMYTTGVTMSGISVLDSIIDNRLSASTTNVCHGIYSNGDGVLTATTVSGNTVLGTSSNCAGQSNNDGINLARQTANLVVMNNNVTGSMDGLDISGPITSARISGNFVHHNRSSGSKIHGGTGCPSGVVYTGNLSVGNAGWGLIWQDTTNSVLANNTVIHFHDAAFPGSNGLPPYGALEIEVAVHAPYSCTQSDNKYVNNILTGNYNDGLVGVYTDSKAAFEAANVWKGNVLLQRGSQTKLIGWVTDAANDITTSNFATWVETHPGDQLATPEFVSASGCTGESTLAECDAANFRLPVASVLRGTGKWAGYRCYDMNGVACYEPPDIGAYQYLGGVTITNRPTRTP